MACVQGDTIWLRCTFYNREGDAEDRTGVTLKVYDAGRYQLGTTITAITHVGTGIYEYGYLLPAGYNKIIYEFSGLDLESKPQVYRGEIDNIWTGEGATFSDAGAAAVVSGALTDHLTDTTDAHDASAISVTDAGDVFTGTNVQTILVELEARIAALE